MHVPQLLNPNGVLHPDQAATGQLAFLDFDDVICLNDPYGGYDAFAPARPADLCERLFLRRCVDVLRAIDRAYNLEYVITTSWLRLTDLSGLLKLISEAGLGLVADKVRPNGEAFPAPGETRAAVIERWLRNNGGNRPYVVIDDTLSGVGVAESALLRHHAVLCNVGTGLEERHVQQVAAALSLPPCAVLESGGQT